MNDEPGLQCRCGLIVPREQLVGYLCPECRLARILTEYDRPSPDRVAMAMPGPDRELFSTKGQEEP
ncbi:hypothetical protein [uncultured Desulfosarcina sp.]|uniref:hypothetical protein n=1 Tax=uncultured Desulfosarcina sp. TaxID=218289 RepID=UPI0029C701A3|nr:hypothetical protein [uncultured Desulfosarcina sp.]